MWLHLREFRPNHTKKYCARLFGGLREGDVECTIRELIPKDNIVRGRNIPFLLLAGIRGVRPYALIRVLRQFGIKQIVPQVRSMNKFKVDYIDDTMPYVQMIIWEWKSRRVFGTIDLAPNRFEARYDKLFKAWLTRDLQMTLTPGPDTYDQVEDMESKAQVDLPMSEESVNAPIPIIDLVSDGEMKEISKIEERTTLTRKRITDAEQRIANILKPFDRISGFGHYTRRLTNNNRPLSQKGKDKMETSLSGESIGSSPDILIVNHGILMEKKALTAIGTGLQAQTKEGNLQGITKCPISLKVFRHQCRSEVVSYSYLHEALCGR
ncbi:hypothetical protein HAX54_042056 [Datura stramonium]|uniref:Uncharacterized protein n=1 Tax=Datura stramonium TaxID=4076 RepID=A0ABS8W0L0_DATST|nr:hypothetical protein [Datura stramonium]